MVDNLNKTNYNKLYYAAVTQLDRVPGYEPGSQEFESLQPRQSQPERKVLPLLVQLDRTTVF